MYNILLFLPNHCTEIQFKSYIKDCHQEKHKVHIFTNEHYPFLKNVSDSVSVIKLSEDFQDSLHILSETIAHFGNKKQPFYILVNVPASPRLQAALHFSLMKYPNEVKVVSELEHTQPANFLALNKKEELYQHAHELIVSGNYNAARSLLHNRTKQRSITHLLDFGVELKRLNSDYHHHSNRKLYWDILETVLANHSEEWEREQQYIQSMKRLKQENQYAFLYFLQSYTEELYRENDLIDFVVLFYRLAEEALLFAMGWDTKGEQSPFFKRTGETNAVPVKQVGRHFSQYLAHVKQEYEIIQKKHRLEDTFSESVLENKSLTNYEKYVIKLYKDFSAQWLRKILELRHEGVAGHGFAEYSKELIENLSEGSPIQQMNLLLERWNMKAPCSLFQLIQKASLALIAEELLGESVKIHQ